MNVFSMMRWSPYIVGILIGLLNLAALFFSNKVLGASTSYARASGMVRKFFDQEYVSKNEYYLKTAPEIDWGFMLVIGIIFGSFLSAVMSGDFKLVLVPNMWADEISSSFFIRFIISVFGGIVLGIGSRWSGGCTSGHGISGTSQLSVISWVASVCFFVGGIATAFLIYGF
ncbi:MAG: YeeE/YedE family protein [Tissierellales bacterium]|nr:YeeE/YedE family protein [Tissierellales bacterium]MBN2827351.1 YeeE/YedE family protein [Tissierellales bacterium]